MRTFTTKELSLPHAYHLLTGGIAPRPIALVSTLNASGQPNLAPFSFFNVFGHNPPMVAFSPVRRGRDGSFKDTYNNLKANKFCVIHAVTHDMRDQMNISSNDFPSDVNEFKKSGFTAIASQHVKAPRVKESPFHMECILKDLIHLGEGGGSGNLAICEVVCFHVDEAILTKDDLIDPHRIDLIGRNGGATYTRAFGDALFDLEKPAGHTSVGFDGLPAFLTSSKRLSGHQLSQLASCQEIPSDRSREEIERTLQLKPKHGYHRAYFSTDQPSGLQLEQWIIESLAKQDLNFAWILVFKWQEHLNDRC